MKKILKRKDYDRIEEELNILIEDYGVKYFPMDCFEVASLMNIEIKSYSQFSQDERYSRTKNMWYITMKRKMMKE